MAVRARPITVPRTLLLQVWDVEELGDPHPVLGGLELYVARSRAEAFTHACWQALTGLGLAEDATLTPEFRLMLRVLSSPDRELYCWSAHADDRQDRRFLFCAAGGEAAAMQVRGEVVSIVPVEEHRLLEQFIDELPGFPPAPGSELTIAEREFERHDESGNLFSSGPDPVRELTQQLEAPREAIHQVYVARTLGGTLRRSRPFSVIDISEQGRVLIFVDGQDHLHRLPGTPMNLAKTLAATWRVMAPR